MKKVLLPLHCHIRPRFLSHKTGTDTELIQELTMENGNLKHMDGKSCPVILLIEQCKALSLRSRLLKERRSRSAWLGSIGDRGGENV